MPESSEPMVDPRGPRFGSWVSTTVLIVVLLTGSAWLATVQAFVFALGTIGLRYSPYGAFYRAVIAPRLGPPTEREAASPLRFAQGVGLVFVAAAAIACAAGLTTAGMVVTALALAAIGLNAAFGICVGCLLYLRLPSGLQRLLATS